MSIVITYSDDLLSDGVLNKYGEVKDLRFGRGRGASGDVMYVDYFTWKSSGCGGVCSSLLEEYMFAFLS